MARCLKDTHTRHWYLDVCLSNDETKRNRPQGHRSTSGLRRNTSARSAHIEPPSAWLSTMWTVTKHLQAGAPAPQARLYSLICVAH